MEDWLDTEDAKAICGLICFEVAPIAHVYQELGEGPDRGAEYEQSFVIRKMLKLLRDHPEDWHERWVAESNDALNRLRANRREAWAIYRRNTAHAYSDATTPGFFPPPPPPPFPDPDAEPAK